MTDKLELVKTFAPIAAPLTAAIVETWVKPKLQKLQQFLKTDKALLEASLGTKFDEYLQRVYLKNSFINVIVFQNQQKRLEDIYIPLSVKQARSEVEVLIDDYREEFIPTYEKVLISDTAGMGKSTLMKFLFLACVNRNEGIPIFIELRKLTGDEPILSYIHSELNPLDEDFDKDFILKLIKGGGFIFFFDGFDEIPFAERDKVTSNLQEFISKAGDNCFVLTSRPESALASFSDFQEFNIKPLGLKQAFALLKRFDRGGELSSEIISKISGVTLDNLKEFLTNPLLVSLLYKSYEHKRTIPFKKHIFYRQVYDALYESHDLTKGGAFVREKHSGLDVEDFHRALRALGFITFKFGRIEFEKDRWLSLIAEAKSRCAGLDFKESGFLKDLLTTVPLFTREGDYFKWAHKSLQEYFAAQFICIDAKSKQEVVMRKLAEGSNAAKFYNVLDLCYDIDYKTFRRVIVYDLICEYINYYENSFTKIERGQIAEDDISLRKAITHRSLCGFMSSSVDPSGGEFGRKEIDKLVRESGYSTAGYTLMMYGGVARVFDYRRNGEELWRLLRIKGEDILLADREMTPNPASFEVLKKAVGDRLGPDEIIVLDDDPNSPVNQVNTFVPTNEAFYEPDFHPYISYDKCLLLKNRIQEEMDKDQIDQFFIDNL